VSEKLPAVDEPSECRFIKNVCVNSTFAGATLGGESKKPFDMLAEGLLEKDESG
jgi:hypothetical protein